MASGAPRAVDALDDDRVERYVSRLRIDRSTWRADADGLAELCRSHLEQIPFENLDIVFRGSVGHDLDAATDKIVDRGQGGWCFELNGVFARLLVSLGFEVRLLGAAVLLDGPSTVLEHLALEVSGGIDALDPRLVDVGFGESFVTPLRLNTSESQDGGNGRYSLLASPQGTTLARDVDGVPAAQYRFKRVAHAFDDFAGVATVMQTDPERRWSRTAFATRLLLGDESGETPGRVTLRGSTLKIVRPGTTVVDERTVADDEWSVVVATHFPMIDLDRWPRPAG